MQTYRLLILAEFLQNHSEESYFYCIENLPIYGDIL